MRYSGQKLKWKNHQKFPLSVMFSSPNEVAGGWGGGSQPSTSVLFSHFLLFLNFIYVFSLLIVRQRETVRELPSVGLISQITCYSQGWARPQPRCRNAN